MNYFVTGTDTGAGKTYVTVLLTRALRRAGFDTVVLKPVCCGARDDVAALCAAADDDLSHEAANPLWFRTPVAPLLAARIDGGEVDLPVLGRWFEHHRARRRSVLVEGAGGWLVPLTPNATVADLAVLFGLPVLLVVANRLGCLNHMLLTIESIRSHGLSCAGIALNTLPGEPSPASETNRSLIQEICDVPILFDIRPGQQDLELAVA